MTEKGELDRLIALYQSVINEISVLRNQEWKITQLFVLFGVGVIGLCLNEESSAYIKIPWINIIIIIIEIFVVIFGSYHLLRTHKYLTLHRQMRRKVEEKLKFHDKDFFNLDKSILPEKWKSPLKFKFELFSLLLPFLVFNIVVQLFAIYLLLKLYN